MEKQGKPHLKFSTTTTTKKGRGYNHYQEIVLHDVKRERSGRATRRWPIFRENVFFSNGEYVVDALF
jgi:hypothetical protein